MRQDRQMEQPDNTPGADDVATASADELLTPPQAARELARLWGRRTLSVDSIYGYIRTRGLRATTTIMPGGQARHQIARADLERFARANPKLRPGRRTW